MVPIVTGGVAVGENRFSESPLWDCLGLAVNHGACYTSNPLILLTISPVSLSDLP
jgi:hypothetical protein